MSLKDREDALAERLKDCVQRESVLQGRIVDASGREADLMRKLGEMAGTISTAQVQCRP